MILLLMDLKDEILVMAALKTSNLRLHKPKHMNY